MRPNDVSRFGYIFCQLCAKVINALEAKPGLVEDPLGSDAKFHAWFCSACDLALRGELEHAKQNGHDPSATL